MFDEVLAREVPEDVTTGPVFVYAEVAELVSEEEAVLVPMLVSVYVEAAEFASEEEAGMVAVPVVT